ncbi:ATP-dependent Clp protease ATP-binding subunit ClpA homolog CD4B, chloroplastic-like protein, partial [Tanacetum coccineum]
MFWSLLSSKTVHVFCQNSNEQRLVTRDFAHVPSMAGALIHVACFAAVDRQKKFLINGTGKSKRAGKMMCNTYASPMRMRTFSGLRGSKALDNIMRTGTDFHSEVAIATIVRRKRVTRVVPKAMFERFTKKAIKVIMLAQAEAHGLGHNFVGTKHILLGLTGEKLVLLP